MLTIRSTSIAEFRRSPFKYFHREELKPTPSQIFGTLVHLFLLQPDKFNETTILEPDFDELKLSTKKTKKSLKEEFNSTYSDKEIISLETLKSLQMIKDNIHSNDLIKSLLLHKDSVSEKTHVTHMYDTASSLDYKLQGTPDLFVPDLNLIIDIKTSADCRYPHFRRSVYSYEYFIQAAVYKKLLEDTYKISFNRFMWLVIENKKPFIYSYYYATQELLELGLNCMLNTLPKMIEAYKNKNYQPLHEHAGDNMDLAEYQKFEYRTKGELI